MPRETLSQEFSAPELSVNDLPDLVDGVLGVDLFDAMAPSCSSGGGSGGNGGACNGGSSGGCNGGSCTGGTGGGTGRG